MLEEAWTQLVDESGGTWPPSPSRQFPSPLDKLHELALEAPNVFSRPDYASMNHDDIKANRAWLVERLQPTDEVLTALRSLNQHQILGMAACMSTLAHMYRWGSVPTLTAAQEEKRNHLPNMILAAQMYLNGRLGIRSTGGTITTLSLCNYDRERDVIYYSMTKNFTPDIIAAELWNAKLFHEMERIAEPFYRSVVQLADDVIGRGKDSTALEEGNEAIRQAFAYFYKYLKEPTVSKAVWSRYAQGFHGWSWDGFEGVSGDQAVMVRVMDALLGIPPTSPPTHLTKGQRDFVDTLRAANIRQRAIAEGFPLATKSINDTLRMLKTWRMGHVKKACFYEDIHLPERKPMSGGKGTDADLGLEGMVARIQMRLQTRTTLTR